MRAKILISVIDDDEDSRVSITSLIESLGFATMAFASAADFLASHDLGDTSCLITDIHMPLMTGLELHRHLMQSGYAIPTILVTAYPDERVRNLALDEAVICYLQKPLDDDGLLKCIQSSLERTQPHPTR